MLCTGQSPNTRFLAEMEKTAVDRQTGLTRVLRTMQIAPSGYSHVFAVGDVADAFGAIKAGHTAYWQVRLCSCSTRGV